MPLILIALATGTVHASLLSNDTVTATLISGSTANWGISSVPAEQLPTGYVLGGSGFPTLNVGISDDGLITVTPSGQSCSEGCGWNLGAATLQFVLDAGAPDIISIATTTFASSLGVTFSFVDEHTFDMNISGSGDGTTNVDVTTGQLEFAPTAPEPGTFLLGGVALAGLAMRKRRRTA